MSRHDTSFSAPPPVVGVAVGTDMAILMDVLNMEEVDTSEDDEEVEGDFGDAVEEDVAVVEAVVLDDEDDAFDVAEVDGTLYVLVEYAGPTHEVGGVSLASRLNLPVVKEELSSTI